jgi:CrcB protein
MGTMLRNCWTYLCIGAGGALGTMLRFWLSGVISAQPYGERFPTGTLVINVTGSFIIGLFATLTGPDGRLMAPPLGRQFFMIGICGGYTTFSAFSLQTLNLARDGQWGYAGLNVSLSVLLCLLGVWLGFLAGQALNRGI